jgi:hypothetical protein
MQDDFAYGAAYAAAYDHVRFNPRARRAAVALLAAAALLLGLAAPDLASANDAARPAHAQRKAHHGHGHKDAAAVPHQTSDAPAGTASISGHVAIPNLDFNGSARVIRVINGSYIRYGYADHNTGNYTVTGLPAGSYRVEFNRVSGYAYSEAQFYSGHPENQGPASADPVNLAAGQARAGVNATLVKGGSISGKLVDGAGNTLAYCRMQAYTDTGVLVGRETQSWNDGTFTIGGLTTGVYKIRVFASRYSSCDGGTQYLTNGNGGATTTDPAGAIGVSVTRGVDHPLASNVVYTIGGRISGHVTLPADARYRDRFVVARNLANGAIIRSAVASQDDGSYTIRGLPTGSYRVTFARLSGIALSQTEFFNNHPESAGLGSANAVPVTQGTTRAAVDAALAKGGSISGHLADGSGNNLAGCYVQAFTPDGSLVTRAAYTDAGGAFTVGGLTTGSYKLRVVNPKKRHGHHTSPVPDSPCDRAPQYYHGTAQLGAGPATAIPVTVGSNHAMGNLVYQLGGIITGHVDLPANPQRSDGIVVVRKFHSHQARSARVDDDGNYTVHGLGAGSYRVTFARVSGFAVAAAEFYNNHRESAGVASANLVDVASGETKTANAALAEGGHITGTLTDGNGKVLHCLVQAFTTDGSRVTRSAVSLASANGAFDIGGLTTGRYYVRVVPMPSYGCHSGRQFLTGNGGPLTMTAPGTGVMVAQGSTTTVTQPLRYTRTERLRNLVAPSISGSTVVGSVLTASPGTWSQPGVSFAYQWRSDGINIPGAMQRTLALTAAQLGRHITVLVTAKKAGFIRRSKISLAVGPVTVATVVTPPPPPPAVPLAFSLAHKASFKGSAKVGQVLKAVAGATTPGATTVTYQWLLNGKAIKKAKKSKYKLTKSAVGKKISLQITYVKAGYTALVSVSRAKKVKAVPKK